MHAGREFTAAWHLLDALGRHCSTNSERSTPPVCQTSCWVMKCNIEQKRVKGLPATYKAVHQHDGDIGILHS